MKIRIFITGGTFDKEYDQIQEKLVFRDSHVQQMLELGKCKVDVSLRTLMMIDSLYMTDADRELIAKNCANCEEDKIVITHGTSTAEKTAELFVKYPELKKKTIVFTGAMSPYAFGSSDGMFNLGCAIAFAQSLPNGVYVAMNGHYLPAGKVTKNTKTGIFEEK
ncbi:MAG: hypothetical protein ACD_58C00093G0001 [uncultured bacterium]|nr:MAG: hypothetical protein ACD_58C00093G0001 [uncultured bacterium]